MRKTKPWLLAIAMLCCSLTASAHDFEVDGIYYNITSEEDLTVEVTHQGSSSDFYWDKYIGDIVIPESVTYNDKIYKVTSIGDKAFEDCSSLTSIEIPNSAVSIGDNAFWCCSGLTSIEIPNSVVSIGDRAFLSCSSLTNIKIGSGFSSIGEDVFDNCNSLASIVVDANNPIYDSRDNCNAIIETATNTLTHGCYTTIIPNSVTTIGDAAFQYCSSLVSIEIPNSVTTIGDAAFQYCSSLVSIEIPNSVTTIGDAAFASCKSLESIEIPNSVTSIEYGAFCDCDLLKKVTIGSGVISLEEAVFAACHSLNTIKVDAANTAFCVEDGVLYNKAKTELICYLTAYNNTTFNIPNSVTKIWGYAFWDDRNLTSITMGNSVTSIGGYAFGQCTSLSSITMGNSVTSIGDYAFSWCFALTSIEIPNSVTSIGEWAFDRHLASITCLASTPPTCRSYAFSWVDKSIPVYVPYNTASAYRAAAEWSKFNNIIEMAPNYDVELTISSAGYATLYSAKALQLPEGVSAYYGKMSADNEWLNLYKLADGKIPANTGVVLHGEEGPYGAWYLDEAPAAISGNALFGYTQDIPTSVITSIGFDVYTLSKEDDVVGFYKYNGETLKAGKAFLRLDRSIAQAPKMRIMDSETGIAEIEREPSAIAPVIYDLQGHRVSDMSRKGIYVVEGKKVIVK